MSKQKYPQAKSTTSTDGAPKRGKDKGYSSAHLHAKRNRKRAEANERQTTYDALTIPERVELAKSRRGNSKRELTRLENKQLAHPTPKSK